MTDTKPEVICSNLDSRLPVDWKILERATIDPNVHGEHEEEANALGNFTREMMSKRSPLLKVFIPLLTSVKYRVRTYDELRKIYVEPTGISIVDSSFSGVVWTPCRFTEHMHSLSGCVISGTAINVGRNDHCIMIINPTQIEPRLTIHMSLEFPIYLDPFVLESLDGPKVSELMDADPWK